MILDENKKTKEDITIVKQQEKKKSKLFVNSIEPKPNHQLFEFYYKGTHFECKSIDISKMKPAFTLILVEGKWINKEKIDKPRIDIFDPNFKYEKKSSLNIDFNPECIYITALNYKNACDKLKLLNSHLFN